MLQRKQSITGGGPEYSAAFADYGPDHETMSDSNEVIWPNRPFARRCLRGLALLSLVSVMLNTPKTFDYHPWLKVTTYVVDIFCAMVS